MCLRWFVVRTSDRNFEAKCNIFEN